MLLMKSAFTSANLFCFDRSMIINPKSTSISKNVKAEKIQTPRFPTIVMGLSGTVITKSMAVFAGSSRDRHVASAFEDAPSL